MDFFDANCTIGRPAKPPLLGPWQPAAVAAALAQAGVGRALVCHSLSIEAHPNVGNARVLADVAEHPALEPCWTALPPTTGEFPTPDELVEAMRVAGVRAVRLCPSADRHQFPLDSAHAELLLGTLAEHCVPTLLDSAEVTWPAVEAMAKAHPRLPIILLGVGYRSVRALYPLFDAAANVRIEISLYQGCGVLREGVQFFGARRFLFGTGLPRFEPGCAIAHVLYTAIADEDKALIAAGNLAALLEEVAL